MGQCKRLIGQGRRLRNDGYKHPRADSRTAGTPKAASAAGAGVPVQEVNRLLKQFEQTQDMMKRMKRGGLGKMMRALGQFGRGGFPGMGSFGR